MVVHKIGFECSSCGGIFPFSYKGDEKPYPDACTLCGVPVEAVKFMGKKRYQRIGNKKEKPNLFNERGNPKGRAGVYGGAISQSADQVYKQMEVTSQNRIDQAAEMLGVDSRTLSHMKTTNMKDNVREGEISYIPPSNTPAAQIHGQATAMAFGTGEPIKSGFGMGKTGNINYSPSGQVDQVMKNVMSSTSLGHESRVQATVAAGIRK